MMLNSAANILLASLATGTTTLANQSLRVEQATGTRMVLSSIGGTQLRIGPDVKCCDQRSSALGRGARRDWRWGNLLEFFFRVR
jgi:hypothetical protein